jgi:tetratricopeptide (TPR) repeat protein
MAGRRLLMGCCLFAAFQFLPPTLHASQTQVGRPAGADDAQTLRNAQGAFNNNNFVLARQLAERIRDVPGSIGEEAKSLIKAIDDINDNNKKLTSARISIQKGKFTEACDLLRQIQTSIDANKALRERYPDLNTLKTQAGGCPVTPAPEQADPAKADYDKAVRLREQGKLQDALLTFLRIQKSRPGYKDVDDQVSEIKQELSDSQKKNQDERFADLSKKANQFLRDGDLRAAARQLSLAEAIRPADSSLAMLRQQIEGALKSEENELVEAITAFYGGRYEQAQKALDGFLGRRHPAPMIALARFYTGAAWGSQFFLSGGTDQSMKNTAMQMFQQTLKDDPSYSPRWDAVSQKIKDLYSEATGKSK